MTEPNKQHKSKPEPLTDDKIVGLASIFPGFDVWYRKAYNPDGTLKPKERIPGLKPQPEEHEDE